MLTKAKSAQRQHAEQLLERQRRSLKIAFGKFVAQASHAPGLEALIARGDVSAVLALLDNPIRTLANAWGASFIDVGHKATMNFSSRLQKATVSSGFNVTDDRAVEIMRQRQLNLIANLTTQQRNVVRDALLRGQREGLGPEKTARLFRDAVGLSDRDAQAVETYRRTLSRQQSSLERELSGEDAVFEPETSDVTDRKLSAYARTLRDSRAETIARTERMRVMAEAQDTALRQSLDAVGQSPDLTGKEWAATHDSRTRDAHAARDGQRRRLDDAFDNGIMQPGDGPPEESINCRCVLLYSFFDTEEALQSWLNGE